MSAPAIQMSRPLLLERSLLFTLSCSLIAEASGGNLPCTDAWAFFTLLSLYVAGAQHRPIVIAFIFGCITLFSDIIFLAVVRRSSVVLAAAGATLALAPLPSFPAPALLPLLTPPPTPPRTPTSGAPQVKRNAASSTFSAFEYLGKAASTYLLYFYLRSDLGGILSLAGEPAAASAAAAGADYQYREGSSAVAYAASEGPAAEPSASAPPYSGGFNSGAYNASPPGKAAGGGGYQSSL